MAIYIHQCSKCGKQVKNTVANLTPTHTGKCPDTSSGHHVWVTRQQG